MVQIYESNMSDTTTTNERHNIFYTVPSFGVLNFPTDRPSFQNEPVLKPTSPPLLHLPLSFPSASTTPLTSWATVTIYLPALISHFSSRALVQNLQDDEEDMRLQEIELPSARFSHVSYIKVYATCRLKRIWFSEADSSQRLPWEFELYTEV